MFERWSPRDQFILALLAASAVSVVFYFYGAWRNHSGEYSYLIWNLFLAWLPLVFAVRLIKVLKHKLWSSWEGLAWSFAWLVFLPNSFYMISDFIHLREIQRVDILYDALMFTSFIYTGVVLGFSSLYLVHLQLRRRLDMVQAAIWTGLTLFICSIAIYIGRDLRWNSWDIITNPGGLLFDVSERLGHITNYPQMLVTIFAFFILLSSMYGIMWSGARFLRSANR
jgi:uncharacterized membrane protein